jgi:hypothetical protein
LAKLAKSLMAAKSEEMVQEHEALLDQGPRKPHEGIETCRSEVAPPLPEVA